MIGGSETNSPEAAVRFPKLTGGIIGTAGSWGGSGNTITNVFDGDLTTYFDAPDPGNGDWVGLDFGVGVSNVITRINYCPRSDFPSRMTNGIFQGANQADFCDAVTLFTITNQPATGAFTTARINNASPFRYVRYLSPDSGYGNVAELQFYGYRFFPPPLPIMSAALTGTNLTLSWPLANTGYTLQSRTNLVLGAWSDAGFVTPQIVSNQWQVVIPLLGNTNSLFYRLSK
jgi:hypothetical protein